MTPAVYFKRLNQAERVNGVASLLNHRAKKNNAAKNVANSLVLCVDMAQMQRLNCLLWTISDDSFLAHGIITDNESENALQPILLTTRIHNINNGLSHGNNAQVLINATLEVPIAMNGFSSIVDFVDEWDNQLLLAARARFRLYKHMGFNPRLI
ncbi:MAG: DNA polymerase III subunit chi [Mariprofundales bacterium]